MATAYQGPDSKNGLVDTSRCVSFRSSHLQVVSLGALQKWGIRGLAAKNAFLRAVGLCREVFLRTPVGWNPKGANRSWKLHAPAYGLDEALVVFSKTLKRYLLRPEISLARVGLKFPQ